MSRPRLVLLPKDPRKVPEDITGLQQTLKNAGLIDQELNNSDSYLAGNDFLNLLTFLGCSPNINLHPDDSTNFCFISFSPISQQPKCLGYASSAFAKCPQCKAKIKNWRQIENWQLADTHIHCENCGIDTPMSKLKWRQEAGYGSFSINIANIHPHEAVPTEKLLSTLDTATGFNWTYFYANNEDLT